ncbi:MAG: cytochrome c biogenesis heme-transporting ATPase CcmA [Pseudomonadales bacterium]
MADALLTVRGLGCVRDGRTLFRALDLSVGEGECVALLGPNGSGKSTLLRAVAGLFVDVEGEIEVSELAYLGHRPGVSLSLSPLENLRWYAGLEPTGPGVEPAALISLLERVGLAGYEDVRCQHLSAGQQRRVALSRLMLDRARLWLLDEPFTALDTDGQALVRSLLVSHAASGGAAVCATHQDLGVPGTRELHLGGAT